MTPTPRKTTADLPRIEGPLGSLIQGLSNLLFNHRGLMLAIFAALTVFLAWSASGLKVDAGFKKMIPLEHPYMKTFTDYEQTFGGANRIIVALIREPVEGQTTTIFDKAFMADLKAATDDLFYIKGVDRPTVQSLFTPNVRFIEIVEGGFAGGNVIPATFQGEPEDLETVRRNVQKAGLVGRLVSNDLHGALIRADLLDVDPETGEKLNYPRIAAELETLRAKYQKDGITVHIIGFAKAVGDITDGAKGVIAFFLIAFVITALLLLWYTKSAKLTGVALVCALLPVLWLLGSLPLAGYGIDPLSILVPFLIFSIGCSHAVQMTNAWKDAIADGFDSTDASRFAFSQLFIPGTLALVTNALGFLVIMLIEIDIVRELGITATLGVSLMIVTNKMVLPILLTYLRIDQKTLDAKQAQEKSFEPIWRACSHFAERRTAVWAIAGSVVLLVVGFALARGQKVGDLGSGLPELREDSRYNRDNAAITNNFKIGVDVISIVVQTHDIDGACTDHRVMDAMDAFEWKMKNVAGIASAISLPGMAKIVNAGFNEGSLRWRVLARNRDVLAQAVTPIDTGTGLLNSDCSAMQMLFFTSDHQGETLAHIVQSVKDWNLEFHSPASEFKAIAPLVEFKLASGNAGVMAATNEAVEEADKHELAAIFGAITLMCLLTFRSFGATLCIILPLALVSLLNNALMAALGIGLKVSTLPVVALGVGVGVDYGIYLYDRIEVHLHHGKRLTEAFFIALKERGAAAAFTAVTMSLGVATWAFSALKFQADMGLLLSFMFLVNMLGALILLPSLLAFFVKAKKA
ncbi:efflux RND transporter permease subunit [Nevskia ramosa]|uniref:efflux RND transporter permease subunit n=1 Tax=Nevskia ramosa TaxID=64002 RepID=UPI0003B4B61D|nr:MMPL family transporter [Nevskia ramosa]